MNILIPCPTCDGEGRVERGCSRHPSDNCDCEIRPSTKTCDRCNGDGEVDADEPEVAP